MSSLALSAFDAVLLHTALAHFSADLEAGCIAPAISAADRRRATAMLASVRDLQRRLPAPPGNPFAVDPVRVG